MALWVDFQNKTSHIVCIRCCSSLFLLLSLYTPASTVLHTHMHACATNIFYTYFMYVADTTNLIQISCPWQTTHTRLPFPDDESIKTELDKDDKFVSFIRDFSVDVFNKSYQMVWLHSTCFQLFKLYLPSIVLLVNKFYASISTRTRTRTSVELKSRSANTSRLSRVIFST